jgi:hypothetical protein
MALSVAGYPEAAKTILITTFDQLPTDDEGGRLLAAGHSLMARGLLAVDSGESRLESGFANLLGLIVEPDYMLQLGLRASSEDEEQTLSYFFKSGTTVEQRIEQGVIYNLRTVWNRQTLVDAAIQFFAVEEKDQQYGAGTAEIPVELVDKARDLTGQTREVEALFSQAGVPPKLARALARDFQAIRGRGMVMLIENRSGLLVSDEGFLVMQGMSGTWLFPIVQRSDETYARVLSASTKSLGTEVQRLLGKVGS